MVLLGPVIPLYLNPDMINNLYSILIQEFIEARSVSIKKQVITNIRTPLSEFSYDIWGRYVQGELNVQSLEEFIKQRSEENISATISALKKLSDILGEQNLLTRIDDGNKVDGIKQGDFVNFTCGLNENPVFQHVSSTIKALEASRFGGSQKREEQDNKQTKSCSDILPVLKDGLNECRNSKCIRYVSEPLMSSTTRAVIPLEGKNMLVNNDYMLDENVNILGKVIRTRKSEDNGLNLLSGTYFDYMDFEQFNTYKGNSLRNAPVFTNISDDITNPNYPLMEVLPIAIFI